MKKGVILIKKPKNGLLSHRERGIIETVFCYPQSVCVKVSFFHAQMLCAWRQSLTENGFMQKHPEKGNAFYVTAL